MKRNNRTRSERIKLGIYQFNKFSKDRSLKVYKQSNKSKIVERYIANESTLIKNRLGLNLSYFKHFIVPGSGEENILIPKHFAMCDNYSSVMKIASQFASSVYDYPGMVITLDFSICEKVDVAALFFIQVLRLEMTEKLESFQSRLQYTKIVPSFKITLPKSANVIRLLRTSGYPVGPELEDLHLDTTFNANSTLGYFKGSAKQKHYRENRKGVCASRVVDFFNHCLSQHGHILNARSRNSFDGIITEVLSNCEDHSDRDTWFLTANFSKETGQGDDENTVGELNLTIMNFGESFFEGYEKTKNMNHLAYDDIDYSVTEMLKEYPKLSIGKEQLFTLIMMSDRISRLSYKDSSRGTGTIKLLNSFLNLGDFVDKEKNIIPNLSLFTGNTHLICDNNYKPFIRDNVYLLSLNNEKDLTIPPVNSHLKKLNEKFPGTLISAKIYFNKKHLDIKHGERNGKKN